VAICFPHPGSKLPVTLPDRASAVPGSGMVAAGGVKAIRGQADLSNPGKADFTS